MRPGEGLYEKVLFGNEDVRSTEHPKVLRVFAADTELGIIPRIDELIRLVTMQTVSDAALRSAVTNLVPDLITEPAPKDFLPIKKRDSGDIRRA